MSSLDAYFGRLFSAGVELELRGGLNASTGLQVTPDSANDRNDLSVNFLRVLAVAQLGLDSGDTTALDTGTYAELAGDYSARALTSSLFTAAETGAGLVWGGTETVTCIAILATSIDPLGSSDTFDITFAVDGTPEGDEIRTVPPTSYTSAAPHAVLVELAPGETLSVQIKNVLDGDDVIIKALSLVVIAIGGSS